MVWKCMTPGIFGSHKCWPNMTQHRASDFLSVWGLSLLKCNKINSNLCGKGPEFMTSKKWQTVAEVLRLHLPILMFNTGVLSSCWHPAGSFWQSLIPLELELDLFIIFTPENNLGTGDTHLASSRKLYVKKMIQIDTMITCTSD